MVPDPYAPPQGCSFNPRCDAATARKCNLEEPAFVEIEPGHLARCFAVT
jgi:oligopeptide/dipeptide ABC transporter ATP-binding protein